MGKSSKRRRARPSSAIKARREPAKAAAVAPNPADYGSFEDCVHACWLKDGRNMVLLEPLVFHQTKGNRIWSAPLGACTDGASIPSIFWSVIGGPFEGKYRDAAVNHDYECCVQQNLWQDVHRMFYDGMMARGEEFWRAKLMYFAVYFFGPRWPKPQQPPSRGFTEGDVARAADVFQSQPDVTLEGIEQLTPATLRARLARIPFHIEGAKLLNDSRKIRAVTRKPPCLQPQCV